MNAKSISLLVVVGIAVVLGSMSFYTVSETQQAIVMQFRNPKEVVRDPGLHYKHFFRSVFYFDKRILNLDVDPEEIIAIDQKRLRVDAFARFRIIDPLETFKTVQNENNARRQLAKLLSSNMRQILGSVPLNAIVSGDRAALMLRIREGINREAAPYGIEIIDVRIKRADLPAQNSAKIYQQMNSEREQEAQQARSEGREAAQRIRADADRQVTVILAEAERDSQIIRGQGDSEAVRIFAESFGRDEEFFGFYRSMQAYKKALQKGDTSLVLSPDSEFFTYFSNPDGNK